jgi:DNA-binding MarR family transcriptional regulator
MIENQIRGQLRESFEKTLPRFDVMAQLYRYPDGLRMGEISQLLMVTSGNITGIIDQLEKENLVERSPDPDDRRAFRVQLTKAGVSAFEDMASLHRGWVTDLTDGLSDDEQELLQGLLTKLRDSLQGKLDDK